MRTALDWLRFDGNVVSSLFRHDCDCDLPFSKATPSDSKYSVGQLRGLCVFLRRPGELFVSRNWTKTSAYWINFYSSPEKRIQLQSA